jgi:hypothetical protein
LAQEETPYPVQFSVDYPDRQLNRLTTFFRLIVIIPIFVVLVAVGGGSSGSGTDETGQEVAIGAGGMLVFAPLLMILFRRKYPRWWFDWNVALIKFTLRVESYLLLLRDEYPSTDEEQAVHLEISYPDAERELNRWLPLVKWILAVPHYIVLFFLIIVALVLVIFTWFAILFTWFAILFTWFAILFTGRYPRIFFDYVVGTMRWTVRVEAYAFILVTDQYPPFRLAP